jgi:hypothetical protein
VAWFNQLCNDDSSYKYAIQTPSVEWQTDLNDEKETVVAYLKGTAKKRHEKPWTG